MLRCFLPIILFIKESRVLYKKMAFFSYIIVIGRKNGYVVKKWPNCLILLGKTQNFDLSKKG
jgi:hypothetical protein